MAAQGDMGVDVLIGCDDDDIPDEETIRRWVQAALDAAGAGRAAHVSVRIVTAEEMRSLNREFRERDQPTNVLSFPGGPVAGLPAAETEPLGDIAVCASVVREEALRQGKSVADHWAHMLVHGTLHLLGHDHLDEREAQAMEALEQRILGAAGIADPYRAR